VYLYVAPDLVHGGSFEQASLAATTERHHIELAAPALEAIADPLDELPRRTADGAVFALSTGIPNRSQLDAIAHVLKSGTRAWIYFPAEQAIECVDEERLESLHRHLAMVRWLKRIGGPLDRLVARVHRAGAGLRWIYRGEFPVRRSDEAAALDRLIIRAQPVAPASCEAGRDRIAGVGMLLQSDFWNTSSGGGTTADVAAQLAGMSDRVVCVTTRRDGPAPSGVDGTERPERVDQVVIDAPEFTHGQDAIIKAPRHYLPLVKVLCQTLRPAYLYERVAAGQSAGAELSQLLRIPYIVEYPGHDELLRDALDGAAPAYAELYDRTELLAIRQAAVAIVPSAVTKEQLVARGVDAGRVIVAASAADVGAQLPTLLRAQAADRRPDAIATGDSYKDQVQNQWNENPVGSHHARESQPHTLEWFREVERHRYGVYAPWMPGTMEFAHHAGHDVLEIGGGLGTDLAQFAAAGATVTDLDLAAGHLQLAEENFRLRGLTGRFIHHDAERLPFPDASFDLVYSNGVLHHTPNTAVVVTEILRVLRPGGRTIVMLYAEDSLHYWRKLVWGIGVQEAQLDRMSMGAIMSGSVERSANEAKPLVKVYTTRRAQRLFKSFDRVEILQRQLLAEELPAALKWTRRFAEPMAGWNLIVKAAKRG
jgi:ubiquinone/menaquinone biosynthesis C-methylase UbiE